MCNGAGSLVSLLSRANGHRSFPFRIDDLPLATQVSALLVEKKSERILEDR